MIISIILTVLFVFGIPLSAVLFASHSGLAICLLSFYLINPIVSVFVGTYSGLSMKKRWYLPILPAIVFLITVWTFFTISEPIFLFYSAVYLVFGLITMFITHLICQRKK